MPIYEYKGLNAKGKPVAGVKDADTPRSLKELLRKDGIFLSQYQEGARDGAKKAVRKSEGALAKGSREVNFAQYFRRIKLMEVAEMTRQFATLLKAGIPVVDSISALIAQTENEKLKRVLTEVRRSVNEGAALGQALSAHPKVFSDLYVNMVRAGESSGTLDLVFVRLSEFTESQVRLRTKVSSTMAYPIIMMIIGTAIVSLLMIFVIPKMTDIFTESGLELPFLTRALIAMSDLFVNWWFLLLGGVFGAMTLFRRWKATAKGRLRWDGFKLRMPIFGTLFRMIAVTRFARTLATLLSSGVPLLAAMNIVRNVVDNAVMAEVLDDSRDAIREGHSLAGPLEKSKQFPPMVTHMIAIGEKTGQLEEMLDNVGSSYEMQVDAKVSTLTTVLEPLMIVVMGVVVGLVVFAILTPMMKMNEAFQSQE